MFSSILSWLVLVLPVVLTVIFIFVPDRRENPTVHTRWSIAMVVAALLYSGLIAWQQNVAARDAKSDRDAAVGVTSSRVAKETTANVTKALEKQYGSTISEMAKQLREQGENVDTIKQSNIVTGKKPISVIVENPKTADHPQDNAPDVHIASMPATPRPELGQHATQFILTTNKVMNGGHVMFICPGKINNGTSEIAGASTMMGGGGLIDEHTFSSGIESPNWAPDYPLVVTLYYDGKGLGNCRVMLR